MKAEIRDDLLFVDGKATPFVESPNRTDSAPDLKYLVMHYTAGRSAESSIRSLCDPLSKASAHLVIGRDGSVTQLVRFDRIAWHAGDSRWQGQDRLNRFSIGIELDNAGPLMPFGTGFRAWFGGNFKKGDAIELVHQHESAPRYWHVYTPVQIETAVAVSQALADRYDLIDVLGHDDISPGRKLDPGPALVIESFRAAVLGRRDEPERIYTVVTRLNFRTGPGVGFDPLPESPLQPGTRLRGISRRSNWLFVELIGQTGDALATGWVHSDYIRR